MIFVISGDFISCTESSFMGILRGLSGAGIFFSTTSTGTSFAGISLTPQSSTQSLDSISGLTCSSGNSMSFSAQSFLSGVSSLEDGALNFFTTKFLFPWLNIRRSVSSFRADSVGFSVSNRFTIGCIAGVFRGSVPFSLALKCSLSSF
uniref:Uncharacterized protein n=1 Tax=Nyssomyia neivai TaxID=330878 RepID=A0A1L8D8J2_9DIPT